jgi:hypothetical protein
MMPPPQKLQQRRFMVSKLETGDVSDFTTYKKMFPN